MRRANVLAGVTISLGACAMGSSERTGVACVPVQEYRREFLERAADEVSLREATAVVRILEDYAAMRGWARPCEVDSDTAG